MSALDGMRIATLEARMTGALASMILLDALRGITTVCRGPKPTAALRQANVQVSAGIAAPYTTTELLAALTVLPVRGKRLMALQYGERNAALMSALREQCASVDELCLYEWQLPDDVSPMESLIDELLGGRVDVITFTSQVQIRHLYKVAAANDVSADTLSDALNDRTIVCAVGPTCAAALADVGVATDTQPEYPKMGHMVNTLAEYVGELSAVGGR